MSTSEIQSWAWIHASIHYGSLLDLRNWKKGAARPEKNEPPTVWPRLSLSWPASVWSTPRRRKRRALSSGGWRGTTSAELRCQDAAFPGFEAKVIRGANLSAPGGGRQPFEVAVSVPKAPRARCKLRTPPKLTRTRKRRFLALSRHWLYACVPSSPNHLLARLEILS
jgi:hypothetical protein